jgi:3-deoxy-D-manno-octulosonic-acid transferase
MIWLLYNILFAVGFTLVLPKYLWRMWKRGGYRRGFLQRLARYDAATRTRLAAMPRMWIHAVSVGEMYVALRLLEDLRARFPGMGYVVTTNTSTAHRIAEEKLMRDDVLLYFPCDFPIVIRAVLDMIKPRAILLIESELWPNLVRLARARGIPACVVNGRLSDRSFRGYRRLGIFFRPVLGKMELLLAQTASDANRLVALGARPERVHTLGSAKYDVAAGDRRQPESAAAILDDCGMRGRGLVIVGGSTWAGEEAALLDTYERLRGRSAGLKLVLVPRHAERRAEVETELVRRGLDFAMRSAMTQPGWTVPERCDVLLVDTTGELRRFYASADVIFVGKSLTARGGQNIIEPAVAGKPIVIGPNMENFRDVVADFMAADALLQVQDAAGLGAAVERLMDDAPLRAALGQRAAALVGSRCGVIAESVRIMAGLVE